MNPIEYLKPSQIRVDPGNVYTHADGDIARLVHSIQEHSFLMPLVVDAASKQGLNGDASYELVGGEARLEAAKICQLAEIPCMIATFTDKKQRDLAAVALNASYGAWDDTKLATLLQDLQSQGADLDDTGLKPHELDELLASINPAALTDPDDVPESPETPITQRGDLILLGNHRLLCGDSRDFESVSKLLAGKLVNVAVTSPPYASQRAYDESSGFKPIPPNEYGEWYRDVAANIMANLAEDGSYFLNIKEHCEDGQRSLYVKDLLLTHVREWGWRFVDEFCWTRSGVPGGWNNRFKNGWEPVFHFTRSDAIKFRPDAVSHKSDGVFDYSPQNSKSPSGSKLLGHEREKGFRSGMARPSNVLKIETGGGVTQGKHSAEYPVALPSFFISAFSDAGDVVYDPFMGSGTTLIAAEIQSRTAYGCEISPSYSDVIIRRWEDYTGKKAIRPAAKAA